MSSGIRSELSRTFDLAIRRHEAKTLKTSEDWKALQDIENRQNRAREETQKRYRDEYDTRVEQARLDIIAEKAMPTHDIRPPFGTDQFKKDAIEKQAHRRVQTDHAAAMAAIDAAEAREIEELLAEVTRRQALNIRPGDKFARAADRRSGEERRTGRDRRITQSFS